jgi:hypothetical protein
MWWTIVRAPPKGPVRNARIGAGGAHVVLSAGTHVGGPTGPSVRSGDDLDVPAVLVVLAAPPQGHPGCRAERGDPVGCASACRPRSHASARPPAAPRAATAGSPRVPRRPRPGIRTRWTRRSRCPWPGPTSGCLRRTSAAPAPPACRSQRAGALARSSPFALGVQERGQEQNGVLGCLQDSGVCDAHRARDPCEVDL